MNPLIASLLRTVAGLVLAGSIGCSGEAAGERKAPADAGTTVAQAGPSTGREEQVPLRPCRVESGGYAVRIANVSCPEAAATLKESLGLWNVYGEQQDRQALFVSEGWRCWARLEHRFGPILNVCMRGDAVIVYKFA